MAILNVDVGMFLNAKNIQMVYQSQEYPALKNKLLAKIISDRHTNGLILQKSIIIWSWQNISN